MKLYLAVVCTALLFAVLSTQQAVGRRLRVATDYATGCEYLASSSGIVRRTDGSGKQLGCRDE